MITRIEIKNFMSHKHTVIEPAAGLTVLVGPNNIGKSAVVAALRILCHNEKSNYVLRHGERECSVVVTTDDGHSIEWRRKKSPSYSIDGVTFDRLGGGVPDELQRALRLPMVGDAADLDFDVHFGTQKSPIFLLGSSEANAARFFASSSDAIRLVMMQRRHKEKLGGAQRTKNELESESKRINGELELLEPVVDIDRRLKRVEHDYTDLMHAEELLAAAEEHWTVLAAQAVVANEREAHVGALSTLSSPPEMLPVGPLYGLLAALEDGRAAEARALARIDAVASLAPPPEMCDAVSLQQLVQKIAALESKAACVEGECRSLARLSAPPEIADGDSLQCLTARIELCERELALAHTRIAVMHSLAPSPVPAETAGLEELVAQMKKANKQMEECKIGLATAENELLATAAKLRQEAAGRSCAVCGSPLDPDRVVAVASTGVGEHDHD